eukprot:scaffold2585_cov407-Chaetoceros_neogracile.AAC.12
MTTKTLEILFTLQHQLLANLTIDNEDLITTNDQVGSGLQDNLTKGCRGGKVVDVFTVLRYQELNHAILKKTNAIVSFMDILLLHPTKQNVVCSLLRSPTSDKEVLSVECSVASIPLLIWIVSCWILVIVVVSRILSSSSSSFVHLLILALANPEGLAISNIKIHTK